MHIDIQELNAVIADFVQIGYMQAIKTYEPARDLIRLNEVKWWLKMMRIDMKIFNALVENGFIKTLRKGTGRNSPLFYSKKEIKQAFAMANVSGLISKDIIK